MRSTQNSPGPPSPPGASQGSGGPSQAIKDVPSNGGSQGRADTGEPSPVVSDEVLYGPVPPRAKQKRKPKRMTSVSASHNLFTHFPKCPNCRVCQLAKTTRARVTTKAEKAPDDLPEPKQFADAITADHAILNEEDQSRSGDQVVLVVPVSYSHLTLPTN